MPVRIQSVARALRILDTLAQYPEGLGLADIAQQLALNVSTTHHLVNTLCADDYAAQLDSGLYCLGHAVSRLYGAYQLSQRPDARLHAVLDRLASTTHETAYLATWQDGDVVIQAIVEGSQQLRVSGLRVGFRGQAYARASGKVLLAYLDRQQLEAYLATHPLERLTAHTVASRAALKDQLKQVVRRGFALDQEEFADGIGCVAAPILSADGKAVAAISISAPAWRLSQNLSTRLEAVRQAGQEGSAFFGYQPQRPRAVRRGGRRKPAA